MDKVERIWEYRNCKIYEGWTKVYDDPLSISLVPRNEKTIIVKIPFNMLDRNTTNEIKSRRREEKLYKDTLYMIKIGNEENVIGYVLESIVGEELSMIDKNEKFFIILFNDHWTGSLEEGEFTEGDREFVKDKIDEIIKGKLIERINKEPPDRNGGSF